MAATIDAKELTPALRTKLGVTAPRRRGMTMNDVRTAAIRVLAVVADLSPTDRRRVLRQASKLNEV